MNIILFGPPGVGKSTLIGALKLDGVKAIDLEDLYPNSVRFQIPSWVDGAVLGGADLNPQRKYKDALRVLLFMPQKAYEARRAKRDALIPEKGSQSRHTMHHWLANPIGWDAILDASAPIPTVVKEVKELAYGKEATRPWQVL